jgi:hypothetical protein
LRNVWNTLTGKKTPAPFIELAGEKIYAYKDGNKVFQATMQWSSVDKKRTAVFAYQGIDIDKQCKAYEAKQRATCSPVAGSNPPIYKVTITEPTQAEWEAFTILLRP